MIKKLFLSLLLFYYVKASASGICSNEFLPNCKLVTDMDGSLDIACLNKFHACGKYKEIILSLSTTPTVLSAEKRYYLGISYYSLANQSVAQSVKCDYRHLATSELQIFLDKVKNGNFTKNGEFNQAYHAANLLKDMKAQIDCVDNVMSDLQVQILTRDYADEVLRSLFAGSAPNDGLGIAATKASLQSSIRQFATAASDIESQIGMRKVAMDASDEKMANIALKFGQNFGKVENGTFFVNGDTGDVKKARDNVSNWDKMVSEYTQLVESKMRMSIEKYENIRLRLLLDSHASLVNGENLSSSNRKLEGQFLGRSIPAHLEGSNNADQRIKDIYKKWKTKNANLCTNTPKPWYCERG